MSLLSVIIPVLGDPAQLDDTLVSVLQNRPKDCEVVVVFDRPYHDPYNLKDEVVLVQGPRRGGLLALVAAGVEASRGAWFQVLQCGVTVEESWIDAVRPWTGQPRVAAVAPIVCTRQRPERLVSAGVDFTPGGRLLRRLMHRRRAAAKRESEPLATDSLTGFYRRTAWKSVGGLNARLHPTIAWIELAMRLRAAGYRVVVEPNSVAVVSSMDPRLAPAMAHGFATERLYWRATVTDCWQPSLWRHLGVLSALAISVLVRPRNAMQLLGRLCGWALAPLLPRWTMPEPTVEAEQDDGSSTTSTLRRRAKRLAG